MSEKIFLYIIIAIIWAIISLINQANKKQTEKQKKQYNNKNKKVVKKYQNNKLEDEEEIFRNLNKTLNNTLNNEKTINKPKAEKVNKEENKIYETSYKDKEILELQKKYNSIINNKNNIENFDNVYLEKFNFDKKVNNVNIIISSLNIKNAIIYNAILEPKRLNYKRKIKKS